MIYMQGVNGRRTVMYASLLRSVKGEYALLDENLTDQLIR
jgi:hypothetical protein